MEHHDIGKEQDGETVSVPTVTIPATIHAKFQNYDTREQCLYIDTIG